MYFNIGTPPSQINTDTIDHMVKERRLFVLNLFTYFSLLTLGPISPQREQYSPTTFQCDFESPCSLVQDTTDDFDWFRTSRPTPTSLTGPQSGYGGSRYYTYIETTFVSRGQSARYNIYTLRDKQYMLLIG